MSFIHDGFHGGPLRRQADEVPKLLDAYILPAAYASMSTGATPQLEARTLPEGLVLPG